MRFSINIEIEDGYFINRDELFDQLENHMNIK